MSLNKQCCLLINTQKQDCAGGRLQVFFMCRDETRSDPKEYRRGAVNDQGGKIRNGYFYLFLLFKVEVEK